MDKGIFKRLIVPAFFLLLFLIPAMYWDAVIYQVGSELLRRTVWIGRYVIGICLWLALAWCTRRARGTIDIDVNVFVSIGDREALLAALPDGVKVTRRDRELLKELSASANMAAPRKGKGFFQRFKEALNI